MWLIDPRAVRQARLDNAFSLGDAAQRSGVDEKTIRRLEKAGGAVRHATVQFLAKAYKCEPVSLVRGATETLAPKAPKQAPAPLAAPPVADVPPRRTTFGDALPPLSELEQLVDAELAAGLREVPGDDGVPELRAKSLQDVYTVFAVHAGRRFWVPACVERQRGVGKAEADALGCEVGLAARFLLRREVLPGRDIRITVHAREVAHHVALQQATGDGRVRVLVEVVVWPRAYDGTNGFTFFGGKSPRPWGFVVRDVARADGGGDAQNAAARKPAKPARAVKKR